MSLSSLRWRLREFVQQRLLAAHEDHVLRRGYRMLRKFPPVRAAWRLAIRGGEQWRSVEAYAARGGVFAEPATGVDTRELEAFPFDHPDFFSALVDRARRYQPRYVAHERKALIVNHGLAAGGAERQIVYTLKGLRARGVDARFVGEYLLRAAGLDFHLEKLRAAGVPCMALERKVGHGNTLYANVTRPVAMLLAQAPAQMMLEMLDMIALLCAEKPAVAHLWQDDTSVKHGLAALIAGTPRIVLSERNLNPTHFEYYAPHMDAAYRALAGDDRIVMSNNSAAGAQSYARWLGVDPARITVVPNGIDPGEWSELAPQTRGKIRRQFDLTDEQPVVLGVFRLSPEKQPLLWLDAAAAMRRRVPNAAFIVIGEGPLKEAFLAKAQALSMQGALHFLSARCDVHDFFAASDVLLLASAQEGTPNVLLEAQWHGLACVTTDAGGAPEAVSDGVTGMVVRDADATALGHALCDLWDNRTLRARARQEGRTFVTGRFSLDYMIENTLTLYGMN